jgi:hypothetical protein
MAWLWGALYHPSLATSAWSIFQNWLAIEFETGSVIPFLDAMTIRKEAALATKAYRKPIHTDRYLIFSSEHLSHVKRGLNQSLHK